MARFNWGPDGPPKEAYSRVTQPERFAQLHDVAAGLIHRLEQAYHVQRSEGYGLDPELESRIVLARPVVKLVPHDEEAAPIVFACTSFPGLKLRIGAWSMPVFPSCGCDACDEDLADQIDALYEVVDNATAGRFRERVELPLAGDGWYHTASWSLRGSSGGRSRVDRLRAEQMLLGHDRDSHEWAPWPRKQFPAP